jgi:Icc protein
LLNSQKANSPIGALPKAELDFLSNALESHPDLPTLIAVHHHCTPSSSSWLNTMQIENSDAFLALITQKTQVKGVTFGHVHQNYSTRVGHIDIFACPASCFQFAPDSDQFSIADTPPGYRTFELHPDGQVKSEVYRMPIAMHGLNRNAHEY